MCVEKSVFKIQAVLANLPFIFVVEEKKFTSHRGGRRIRFVLFSAEIIGFFQPESIQVNYTFLLSQKPTAYDIV